MDRAYLGSFMLGPLTDITGSERDETGMAMLKRAPLEGGYSSAQEARRGRKTRMLAMQMYDEQVCP